MKAGLVALVVALASATSLHASDHRLAVRTAVPSWFTGEVPVTVSSGSLDSLYTDGTNVTVSVPEYIVDPENARRRIRAGTPVVTSPAVAPFTVQKQGGVFAPIYGISANSSNFFLTSSGITYALAKDFDGNLQETYAFDNPSTAQDATSFDEHYMLQLGTDNALRKVDLSTGQRVFLGSNTSVNVGPNSFGIGYNSAINQIGIGIYANNQMTFRFFDMTDYAFKEDVSFPFSAAKYGTPTGLDFIRTPGGADRVLVSTRDGSDIGLGPRNFVLDMASDNGRIDQYFTNIGSTWKLNDIFYENGDLILVNQRPSLNDGRVQIGDYTPHEP